MKAVRYYGTGDVRCEEVQKPVPQKGEVLVRVDFAGICGSDMHIYNRGMFIENIPETMGHEFSGTVEAAGEDVSGFEAGDRVTADPMVTCGKCRGCLNGYPNTCSSLAFIGEVRPGCFAEYICLDSSKLVRIPAGADHRAAALTEPLAVALNVCERAELSPDDDLLVCGTGPIGLLIIMAAKKLYGVGKISAMGRPGFRLDLAEKLGAEAYERVPAGRYFDKTVEAAGARGVFMQALGNTAPNGKMYVVSIFEDIFPVDLNALVSSQITVAGCNAYERRHLEKAAEVIAKREIDAGLLITDVYDLEDAGDAFDRLNRRPKDAAKILLRAGRVKEGI